MSITNIHSVCVRVCVYVCVDYNHIHIFNNNTHITVSMYVFPI